MEIRRKKNADTMQAMKESRGGEDAASASGQADPATGEGQPTGATGPVGALEAQLADEVARLQAEKQELKETLVRRQADFENYKKRMEKERHDDRHRGAASVVEHLLPALDAFDRALAPDSDPAHAEYQKGFEGIRKLVWDALAKQGLERIAAAGKLFDPHVHHAIDRVVTDEYPEDTVMEELQAGIYVSRARAETGDGARGRAAR